MCNLYRMTRPASEVATLFALPAPPPTNTGGEVYPGTPGWAIAGGAMRSMAWGFPLARKGKTGKALKPKPINNARADKLTGPFWSASLRERRCLIPLEAWAEAEGQRGAKTRSWFSLPGEPVACAAGLWRPSAEWGDCYAMVMTDASEAARPMHDRMPVLIAPGDRKRWLGADARVALDLCRPWPGPLTIDRTDQPWNQRPAP